MTGRVGSTAGLVAVVGLACLLGGCDGDDPASRHTASATSTPGDPAGAPPRPTRAAPAANAPPGSGCDLLSLTRVEEVLAIGPVHTRPAEAGRTCDYLDGRERRVLTVTVGQLPQAMVGGPADAARSSATGSGPRETLPGIAEAAVLYQDPVRGLGLAFARARGDLVVAVDITVPDADRERLVALARTAAAALETTG
ncbi:hypothetical protein B4N89_29095 [Embleya scabrispora]|uniref:DUF3558 domain-containing protein n=1 Tax=Embleya scabrispora TaxID=159449 RepID=A0A1T3P5V9_9ACTN|nr:hypothetical protein [Embleya scabrispora]OPC84443.1 hypothetical protein B4N89_29095 [Embleya scabrispora]